MADELCNALAKDEIELLFQPQFSCADGLLVGAEALARWRHPSRGLMGADRLFAMAERASMVEQVTHHIARCALATAGNWPVPLRLSLNVTPFLEDQKSEQQYGMEHLAIDTDELDALVAKLEAQGIHILEKTVVSGGRRVCFFEGPDGVQLEFIEMKK